MFFKKLSTIIFVFCVIIGIYLSYNSQKEVNGVQIAGKYFSVEISRTRLELERGLSGHISLIDNEGMLFIFEKEDFHRIWMKDMLFPIDILWISSDLRVVHMEKNVLPETYPTVFSPKTKNLYVLEVSAGQIDTLNIEIDDIVKFIKK